MFSVVAPLPLTESQAVILSIIVVALVVILNVMNAFVNARVNKRQNEELLRRMSKELLEYSGYLKSQVAHVEYTSDGKEKHRE